MDLVQGCLLINLILGSIQDYFLMLFSDDAAEYKQAFTKII